MSRPRNYRPLDVKAYRELRDSSTELHRKLVSELKAVNAAINGGRCPACRSPLNAGRCADCSFRIVVAPPIFVDPRATFNRRPTRKGYASRSVPS